MTSMMNRKLSGVLCETRGRLRVCHLIYGLNVGGAEKMLAETVRRLDRARFEVEVATLTDAGEIGPAIQREGIAIHALGVGMQPSLRAFWKLNRFLRGRRYQILHTYLPRANWMGRVVGRLAGVPVIVSSQRASLGYLRPWQRMVDRVTAPLCDRVVCVSDAIAAYTVAQIGVPERKVIAIHNGIAVQRPHGPSSRGRARAELGIGDDVPVVGFVGRLTVQKNPVALVHAAADLLPTLPDLRVFIVGDGPLREPLQREIRERGLEQVVQLQGLRRDVSSVLPGFDVLALPSLFEGLPNVVLESMAAAIPVVATSVDGTPELVVEGTTGYLVPPANRGALALALERVLSDRKRGAAMGQAGRKRVEDKFTLQRMVHQVEGLYEEVALEKGVSAPAYHPIRMD